MTATTAPAQAEPSRSEDVFAFSGLVSRLTSLPFTGDRQLVAIGGAPASGKSTLSERLAKAVSQQGIKVAVVPMDGFHLDNRLLDQRTLRSRKGAPETFDATGFVALMERIKQGGEVVYPLFDRARDLAIAGAAAVEEGCELAIVEGNYLLFQESPWDALQPIWDLSIWLNTPEETILERCIQRWLDNDHSPEQARARAEGNDLLNARRVVAARAAADINFREGYSEEL